MDSFRKKHILKILIFIVLVLVFISSLEFYQNTFSKEREEVRNYIYQHKNLNILVGGITNLTWKKSTYNGDGRKVLEYLVYGDKKNIYLCIYYEQIKEYETIKVKRLTIQNPSTGEIISNDF